jgi:hypothetical protein
MSRYLSLAVLGFAGFLAAPASSQAQTPVGVQVQVGPAAISYQPGYTYVAPRYIVPAPIAVAPTIVVTSPTVYPWYWDGYRWLRHERWEHFHHYGHHR